MILVLLPVFFYNYFTIGKFTNSEFGALVNLGSSACFIEPDSSYNNRANELINKSNKTFTLNDKEILNNSWNYYELSSVFTADNYLKYSYIIHNLNDSVIDLNDCKTSDIEKVIANDRKSFNEANIIATDAKLKHPKLYLKFIYVNFIGLNKNISYPKYFYFNEIISRCIFLKSNEFKLKDTTALKLVFKEYKNIVIGTDSFKANDKYASADFIKKEPILIKLNHYFQIVYSKLFRNFLWNFTFWCIYLYSFIMLIKSRFKNLNYFIIFNMGNFLFFSFILISLSVVPHPLYSYSTDFVYYLMPAFVIQDIAKWIKLKTRILILKLR